MNVLQGSVVRSTAGHDKDTYFVVVGVDGRKVFIADGKERKLEKPKCKNIRHISVTDKTLDLAEITDKKLRKLLNEFSGKVNKITSDFQNSKS